MKKDAPQPASLWVSMIDVMTPEQRHRWLFDRGSFRVPLTRPFADWLNDNMIYKIAGPGDRAASDHYYVNIWKMHDSEDFRIGIKYGYILGSRTLGTVPPEQVARLRAMIEEQMAPTAENRTAPSSTFSTEFSRLSGEIGATLRAIESACEPAPARKRGVATERTPLAQPARSGSRSVEEELALFRLDGRKLFLPEQHLAHYAEIKKRLGRAGATYKRNHFLFDEFHDAAEIFGRLIKGEAINFQQETQFFATPREVGEAMIEDVLASLGTSSLKGLRVLEPSAGDGALADLAREYGATDITVIENWDVNAARLREKGYDPIETDFLSQSPATLGTFDVILANPPFTKNQDIDHVMHMNAFLNEDGVLAAIMSAGWERGVQKKQAAFRDFLADHKADVTTIDAGAFQSSGTGIETRRVTLKRAIRPVAAPNLV